MCDVSAIVWGANILIPAMLEKPPMAPHGHDNRRCRWWRGGAVDKTLPLPLRHRRRIDGHGCNQIVVFRCRAVISAVAAANPREAMWPYGDGHDRPARLGEGIERSVPDAAAIGPVRFRPRYGVHFGRSVVVPVLHPGRGT